MVRVFTSRTCGPCYTYKQNLMGLDGIEYIDVDDPANLSTAIAEQIMQVPTTIFESGLRLTGVQERAIVESYRGGVPLVFDSGHPDSGAF